MTTLRFTVTSETSTTGRGKHGSDAETAGHGQRAARDGGGDLLASRRSVFTFFMVPGSRQWGMTPGEHRGVHHNPENLGHRHARPAGGGSRYARMWA